MIGQLSNSQGSPEVNNHEYKARPICMVMSFHPNGSPTWVQGKKAKGLL